MLTSISISLIIENYGSSSRRIEVLDFRDNSGVTEEDGRRLFAVFSPIIKILNGINVMDIKKNRNTILDLSNLRLKSPEMNIILGIMEILGNIVLEINLSKNLFDHKALLIFSNIIRTYRYLTKIDLSYNPLTGLQGNNTTGIIEIAKSIRETNHVINFNLIGTRVPLDYIQAINRSLEVNRTLPIAQQPLFLHYTNNLIKKNASPPRTNYLENWKPKFAVDIIFSRINRIAERDVDVNENDINNNINLYLISDTRKRNTDV